MRIVVTGQAALEQLRPYLNLDEDVQIPAGQGGVPPIHEIRMLIERGHDVTLVTLDSTVTREVILKGDRLTVHVGPCRSQHAIRDLFREERRYLEATIRSIDPDVVHAHWTYEYALGALDSGYPVVVTIHDAPFRILRWNLPQHGNGQLVGRLARTIHWTIRTFMAWRVARRSRFTIAVSPHTRDHFVRVLRGRGEVEVIPNLMNPDLWGEQRPPTLQAARTADQEFICVAVLGTWGELKNGKTLLEAFALVRASGTNARLLLVGGDYGPQGSAARWARRHNLAGGVEFVGQLSNLEVADLLESADVLSHPSREEACGMAIAEAQLVSTAVIGGSDSGGVGWTLDYGIAGVLVNIESAEQIAGAIVALADDPTYCNQMASAGHDLAMRRYEPSVISARIEESLQHCIEQSKLSPSTRSDS